MNEAEPDKPAGKRKASSKRANGGAQFDEITRRKLLGALRAFKRGDFSVRLPDDGLGIDGQIATVFNELVQQAAELDAELTELKVAVGEEGRSRRRLRRAAVTGGWARYVASVNGLLDDLTSHTDEIARVVLAVSRGDLTQTMDLEGVEHELRGDFMKHAKVVNGMVDQLGRFGTEVTRVAQEVGVEGKLGAQAKVPGVSGSWKELTDSVNLMASNLTSQVREIARVTTAVAKGDLTKTVNIEVRGEILELKNTINTMVDQLGAFADEVTRVAGEVGTEGRLGGQARVPGATGVWRELTENVNSMANNLTQQVRNISEVARAIAAGDLSSKITVEAEGEILELKDTINTMVDQLRAFANEVTRVAREVGTEGVLGGQAEVAGVSGTWRELTENVNSMAANLTNQVRNIAEVTTAIADGDLGRKITVDAQGEILALKNTINSTVDRLNDFSSEVTRVARLVGTEGTLGVQANVKNVSGIWKELTDNVNSMANNLTNQVRNIAEVSSAVANGDLSRKITVDAKGEVLHLKNTINAMVDQLNAFAAEVTRVARDVGVEGKLGGQAEVEGVRGVWQELTYNVNLMADNLTSQVRDIARVTTAVAQGDLTRKITVDAKGEILELKSTINTMVDQLSSFADEVTRLASDVGMEGKLGGQADVRGVSGTWRDLTDAVNSMAFNLTEQVRNISEVATAIAEGDLRQRIRVDARGEILELKNTINTTVDQLSSFADEVTRVARDVGTEGNLGGQASVEGVRGVWKELTDNVNLMASNLTNQVRDIAQVATAIAQGDLGRKVTVEVRGELLELKGTINTMVDQLSSFADEVTRVSRDVGVEGKLGGQAEVRGVSGIWKELTDNVNLMASNLTNQVRDIAQVTTAVANGDLSRTVTVEVRGEILALKNTINTMVGQLSSFADEVTRVAREVGSEGELGGQAEVRGVSGTWRELTDNVNSMARNLTEQVRGIARVVTAVANGDLKQHLRLDARGEIATLVSTINDMLVTLSTFADQVSGVARDVGVEGKLGGQADVPGAAGIWRDLTNNVNELAGNLTRQVRAIGDVATAVTKGDLTRSIDVEARGEVALLKDNINQMIRTLAETTRLNQQQDWLKTNLTRFTRMLQGQRDLLSVADQVLSELAPVMNAQHGAFYLTRKVDERNVLQLFASYAYSERKHIASQFAEGEGLVGQAMREKKRILVTAVPRDYVRISSALGEATPRNIVVVPILFEDDVKGVIELAAFEPFTEIQLAFIDQLLDSLGIVVATIEATMRTDELLRQSQGMAEELQTQQEELQQTNEELEQKARQLTLQKEEVEQKNREVELAKQELEEKAEQLALTSRYKSQFLANMSHELRTPLNSMLILSRQLADNRDQRLSEKEVEYAQIIHQAGSDLHGLINEILDLAKIESGTMALDVEDVHLGHLKEYIGLTFSKTAEDAGLAFTVSVDDRLPEVIRSDDMRVKQVLRNLLTNAFKFTERGSVELVIEPAQEELPLEEYPSLQQSDVVIAMRVRDTGIGIPPEKQAIIFEAFQQADGGTSRKYGGTGLGLAISREIAHLLGGDLRVVSQPGEGSTFTLYLPRQVVAPAPRPPTPVPASRPPRSSDGGGASTPVRRIADDRDDITPGDRVLLIIEDDDVFARTLLDSGRKAGFRTVVASTGQDGLSLAKLLQPDAITLDLLLGDMDGWVLLDRLKREPRTRHIPVHIISAVADRRRGLERGALAVIVKPTDVDAIEQALDEIQGFIARRVKRVLVVEDDETQRNAIVELIGSGDDVVVTATGDPREAMAKLETESFDCMVLDLRLPEMSGEELMQAVKDRASLSRLPIIVYTGKELSDEERQQLEVLADTVIVKDVRSPERLLDETSLFLHRVESNMPEPARNMLRSLVHGDPALRGKRVLVVDDDIRNVFAVTSLLERHEMQVFSADNGEAALAKLDSARPDVVLMDIMLPQMDGYEAMRRIRENPTYRDLPIIALTAKAMKGDREKCIEAGASDYITKPVDSDQLVSLLRVWLYR